MASTDGDPPSAANGDPSPASEGGDGINGNGDGDGGREDEEEEEVPLYALLSTAIDACRRGCQVIRRVHAKRLGADAAASDAGGATVGKDKDKENGSASLSVQYKVEGDSRSALTEADGASQAIILECLRGRWGGEDGNKLRIIGEEDDGQREEEAERKNGGDAPPQDGKKKEEDDGEEEKKKGDGDGGGGNSAEDLFAKYCVPSPSAVPLREDLVLPPSSPAPDDADSGSPNSNKRPKPSPPAVPLSSIVVYVDPMDGTREFVEGRLGNVQCLIGFTVAGQPRMGVAGLPFADEDGKGGVEVVYGVCGGGGSEEESSAAEAAAVLGRLGAPSSSSSSAAADDDKGGEKGEADDDEWTPLPFLPPSFDATKCDNADGNDNDVNGKADDEKGDDLEELLVLSGDSGKPDLVAASDALESIVSDSNSSAKDSGTEQQPRRRRVVRRIVAGGCGNKILRLALSAASSYYSFSLTAAADGKPDHKHINTKSKNVLAVVPRGTCSWDTAAPTAILLSALSKFGAEGDVTDFFGDDLVYDGTDANVFNTKGVLLSSGSYSREVHEKLVEKMKERGAEEIYKRNKKD